MVSHKRQLVVQNIMKLLDEIQTQEAALSIFGDTTPQVMISAARQQLLLLQQELQRVCAEALSDKSLDREQWLLLEKLRNCSGKEVHRWK